MSNGTNVETTGARSQRYSETHDDELWCLATTIAEFVAPRLRAMAKDPNGHPAVLASPKHLGGTDVWLGYLDSMATAFEIIASKDDWEFTDKERYEVEAGLNDFRYWYFSLWT